MITKYEGFTKKRDLFKSMQVKLLSREIRLNKTVLIMVFIKTRIN